MTISTAETARQLERVAAEQTALRRVATLVARGAPSREVVDAVGTEVGKLLHANANVVGRYDGDGLLTAIATWSDSPGGVPVGTRSVLGGRNALTIVAETGEPARVDDYDDASGEAAEIARSHGWTSSIAAPIIVNGRLWGAMLVAKVGLDPFPQGAEGRLAAFTDLVATALANAQAQDDLRRFTDEQAALQRVATLVAQGTTPAEIFSGVSREVEKLLGAGAAAVVKFDHDPPGLIIVGLGDKIRSAAIGARSELVEEYASTGVYRTGRSARVEAAEAEHLDGPLYAVARDAASGEPPSFTSAVASPLVVEGKLWGAMSVSAPGRLPPDTEARLERFTDIIATAIANADSRKALATLAAEQAGLRRIATQVAQGLGPEEIFAAVTEEVAAAVGATTVVMRFDHESQAAVIVGVSKETELPIGMRWELSEGMAPTAVYRNRRPARVDNTDWSRCTPPVADAAKRLGIVSQVATPIFVDGRLWGVIMTNGRTRLPADVEQRTERFSELVATAIANAESKYELAASRRRIVSAGDEARRRIERDLHDGIQQRLVELTFRARALLRKSPDAVAPAAVELAEGLAAVSDELREIARGIHPTILSEAGLGPALRALARRSTLPIEVDVRIEGRFPKEVEAAAYYVASEALANVAKHSQANLVELAAEQDGGVLTVSVRDDGVGGVDPSRGSGILGLKDRIEALGGSVLISSAAGEGTVLSVSLPCLAGANAFC
jgi:signal transduction histidine kinase